MFYIKAVSILYIATSCASAFTPGAKIFRNLYDTRLNESRKPFITGNWKLNPQTKDEAVQLASGVAQGITSSSPDSDICLFVPYVFLESTIKASEGKYLVGAEGIFHEKGGAYTGAVSASMVKSLGIKWALTGHSERRVIYGESNKYINKQVLSLLNEGMSVMLCIGESEEEHDQNLVGSICAVQLKKDLAGVSKEQMSRVAIAYEPIWAIGTGLVATPETAQSVHQTCRSILAEMFDDDVASSTRILYGGSVSPDSIDQLMAKEDVDGVLVGGASLDSDKFARIINFEPVTAMA